MSKNQKLVIGFPIVYSLLLSLFVFVQVNLASSDLTSEAKELLVQTPGQFLISTLLLLIPNVILSFFLMSFGRSHPNEKKNLVILCLSSLAIATLMSVSVWVFFYSGFPHVPVVVFGFPVTYFFGMSIGYVLGIIGIGLRR